MTAVIPSLPSPLPFLDPPCTAAAATTTFQTHRTGKGKPGPKPGAAAAKKAAMIAAGIPIPVLPPGKRGRGRPPKSTLVVSTGAAYAAAAAAYVAAAAAGEGDEPRKKNRKKSKKHKKDPGAPTRPKTAYLLYGDEQRPGLKEKFPEYRQSEIMIELGKMWSTVDQTTKSSLEQAALALKASYDIAQAAYNASDQAKAWIAKQDAELAAAEAALGAAKAAAAVPLPAPGTPAPPAVELVVGVVVVAALAAAVPMDVPAVVAPSGPLLSSSSAAPQKRHRTGISVDGGGGGGGSGGGGAQAVLLHGHIGCPYTSCRRTFLDTTSLTLHLREHRGTSGARGGADAGLDAGAQVRCTAGHVGQARFVCIKHCCAFGNCTTEACIYNAITMRGKCQRHDSKTVACSTEGCSNIAQARGVCTTHGTTQDAIQLYAVPTRKPRGRTPLNRAGEPATWNAAEGAWLDVAPKKGGSTSPARESDNQLYAVQTRKPRGRAPLNRAGEPATWNAAEGAWLDVAPKKGGSTSLAREFDNAERERRRELDMLRIRKQKWRIQRVERILKNTPTVSVFGEVWQAARYPQDKSRLYWWNTSTRETCLRLATDIESAALLRVQNTLLEQNVDSAIETIVTDTLRSRKAAVESAVLTVCNQHAAEEAPEVAAQRAVVSHAASEARAAVAVFAAERAAALKASSAAAETPTELGGHQAVREQELSTSPPVRPPRDHLPQPPATAPTSLVPTHQHHTRKRGPVAAVAANLQKRRRPDRTGDSHWLKQGGRAAWKQRLGKSSIDGKGSGYRYVYKVMRRKVPGYVLAPAPAPAPAVTLRWPKLVQAGGCSLHLY